VLIPAKDLRKFFQVTPGGVLHVGGHLAEEFDSYVENGFGCTIWVEAQPDLVEQIRKKVADAGDLVLQGAAWSETGKILQFNVANNGQSSSLFKMDAHSTYYPEIVELREESVTSVRLDDLLPIGHKFSFINLDIQGAELEALKGLGDRLLDVKWVYSEVNREELYKGIPMIEELDDFLANSGFSRLATVWTKEGWGDALYGPRPNKILPRLRQWAYRSLVSENPAWGLVLLMKIRAKFLKETSQRVDE
jgi:FkbM family methyltransferase